MNNQRVEIVALIRKRFHPLTHVAGPQYAGIVTIASAKGSLYLDCLSRWLLLSPDTGKVLWSDEEIAAFLSPHELVRGLILSASNSMMLLARHHDSIEASDGNTEALLLYYLQNLDATVVDGIALGCVLGLRIDDHVQ